MEIIDELNAQVRPESSPEYLKAIPCGKYRLSIQASEYHYCVPRKTLYNMEDYSKMEFAIFNQGGWFNFRKSRVIRKFPRWEELQQYANNSIVFGYVPVELINEFYLYLITR